MIFPIDNINYRSNFILTNKKSTINFKHYELKIRRRSPKL